MQDCIKIEQQEKYSNNITITWEFTTVCNYKCSYCPEENHDGKYKFPELEVVLLFLDTVQKKYPQKQLFIDLSGGEPTLWPKFSEFVRVCKERNIKVNLISNGSRSLRWWKENAEYLNEIILSYHMEYVNKEHFTNVCKTVSNTTATMVNMIVPVEQFDESYEIAEELCEAADNLIIFMKPLRYNMGWELYPYTEDQLLQLKERTRLVSLNRDKRKNGDFPDSAASSAMIATTKDGKEPFNMNEKIIKGENSWKGWQCNIGLDSFAIYFNGHITRGVCKVGEVIGNIYTDTEFILPNKSVYCHRKMCNCKTDMFISKVKNE